MGLTKSSFFMTTGTPVNVLDYGADPTGVADSAAAIRNAFDAVPQTGGGLYFPPGTYSVQSTVIIPRRFVPAGNRGPGIHIYGDEATLVGQGAGTGVIFETGQGLYSNGGVSNYDAGNELYKHYGTSIEGLFFSNCGIALKLFNFLERCSVINCGFRGVYQGILAKRCFYSQYYNCHVKLAPTAPQTSAGFEFPNENNAITVIGCSVNGTLTMPGYVGIGIGIKMYGASQSSLIAGNAFESLYTGIWIDDDCPGLQIQNNYVAINYINFNLNSALRCTIRSNWIGGADKYVIGVNPQVDWWDNVFDGTAPPLTAAFDITGSAGKFLGNVTTADVAVNDLCQQNTTFGSAGLPNNTFGANYTFGFVTNFNGAYVLQNPLMNNGVYPQNLRGVIDWTQAGDKIPYCTITNNTKPTGTTIIVDTSVYVDTPNNLFGNVFFSFALVSPTPSTDAIAGTVAAYGNVFRFDALPITVTASFVSNKLRLTIGGLNNDTDIYGRVVLI